MIPGPPDPAAGVLSSCLLSRSCAVLSQRDEYRFTYLPRREQEIDVRNGDAWIKRENRVYPSAERSSTWPNVSKV
jgi:hypothetical protein